MKSTFSNGNCVDVVRVRFRDQDRVAVRHSRRTGPGDPVVYFTHAEWHAFQWGSRMLEFEWDKIPFDGEAPVPVTALAQTPAPG